MRKKFIIVFIWISMLNIFSFKNVNAKYVYINTENMFKVQKADNISPVINERNYNVYNENFNKDVMINFKDNFGIKYAKYWFKEESFFAEDEEGSCLETGTVLDKSGYYWVEVLDLYNNKTEYSFMLDKEVNDVNLNIVLEDNAQVNLNIELKDNISGLQKAEVYVDDEIYRIYDYSENNIKEKLEEIIFLKSNIKFYQEVYVICYDKLGNSRKSECIVLNPEKIYTIEDLYRFSNVVNTKKCVFENCNVYLMNNISLTANWNPIYGFKGNFDGQDNEICGLYINSENDNNGFFARNDGNVKNLSIRGEIFSRGNVVAGICAENMGSIVNCSSTVKVTSMGGYVGGIAGKNWGIIEKCQNNSDILSSGNYVGGITGYNYNGTIKKCGNYGNIASNMYAGGICGFLVGNIEQCFNIKTVKSNSYVGGICGGSTGEANLIYLYNLGDVIEVENRGNNGGIVGENNSSMWVKESYNIGNINSDIMNQISPSSVKVLRTYYIMERRNDTVKGIPMPEYLFKEPITNNNSVIYNLSQKSSDIWIIDSKYNDGYPLFVWQIE